MHSTKPCLISHSEPNIRLPIFTDEPLKQGGWHGDQLARSFAKRGVEAVFISLQDCYLDLSQPFNTLDSAQNNIHLPSFEQLPKAAFVRGIAGGTLQQITMRLNILHALTLSNVTIYNAPRAIERTVDKAMTSFLLHKKGISTPQTWACESRHIAQRLALSHTKKLIIKPLFGSQGLGVRLLDSSHLPVPQAIFVDGVFYLQEYIDSGEKPHDYRVFVVNHKAISTMRRTGNTWLSNVAQGGTCESVDDNALAKLAESASLALNIDYCGVDIIRDIAGQLYVLEVNSIPAWRGLQGVTAVNIADALADDLLSKLQ